MARAPQRPRIVMCTCSFHCLGGRRVWKSTYDKHKIETERHARINEKMLNEGHKHDAPPISDVPEGEGSTDTNENRAHDEMGNSEETNDIVDDFIVDFANDITNDLENDIANDVAHEIGGDMVDDEAEDVAFNLVGDEGEDCKDDMANEDANELSLNAIRHAFIKMQSDLDSSGCPISCQDFIMHHLFDGLSPEDVHQKEPKFGAIFRRMAGEWKGELDEGEVVNSWKKLMKMYKNRGMVHPRRYRMCIGSTEENVHDAIIFEPSIEDTYEGGKVMNCTCNPPQIKQDCPIHAEMCTMCNATRKNMIPIDYLPIGSQLQNNMRSKLYSEKMLSSWKNKDRWMGKSVDDVPASIKDFWDGEKCRIYQDWWNPELEWELPIFCMSCGMTYCAFPYKSDYLIRGWNEESETYNFECWNCLEEVSSMKKMIKGDPWNVALAAHWDGFTVSKRHNRSSWVLEVAILNAGTTNPIELIPVLFIPTTFIPKTGGANTTMDKKIKESMVKLLDPFIKELHNIYYDGFSVDYPDSLMRDYFPNIPRNSQVRAMLMLVTGDHPAQCKMGKFKSSGKSACRRCKMHSELIDGRYVFNRNHEQIRHPPRRRKVVQLWQSVRGWNQLPPHPKSAFTMHGQNTGISRESPLWKLYHLYGFDLSLDLVYDVMHIIGLNIFKTYISNFFMWIDKDANRKKKVLEMYMVVGESRPRELRGGQWPNDPFEYHNSFMAEENQKFIQWVLPSVLYALNHDGHMDSKLLEMGLCLIDISHYFFNETRIKGWSAVDLHNVRLLLQTWHILSEDLYGPKGRPLEHVAGAGHILDDVKRFGHSDVYWCFPYEREVQKYQMIHSNEKQVEQTFIEFYTRKQFQNVETSICTQSDGLDMLGRALIKVHEYLHVHDYLHEDNNYDTSRCPTWHRKHFLTCTSIEAAMKINKLLKSIEGTVCLYTTSSKGILIGKKMGRKARPKPADAGLANFLQQHFEVEDWGTYVYTHIKKCMLREVLYEIGDDVVVKSKDSENVSMKAKITQFIYLWYNREMHVFFGANYYYLYQMTVATGERMQRKTIVCKGEEYVDPITEMHLIYTDRMAPFDDKCFRDLSFLQHKFMKIGPIYDGTKREGLRIAYEMCDAKKRERVLELHNRILEQ